MECDCILPGHGPAAIGHGKRLMEEAYRHVMMTLR
jgi:hypothetical protein